ncbi:MAG: hypothetical protein WDA00_05380 [Eubacteriales bacterium]
MNQEKMRGPADEFAIFKQETCKNRPNRSRCDAFVKKKKIIIFFVAKQ